MLSKVRCDMWQGWLLLASHKLVPGCCLPPSLHSELGPHIPSQEFIIMTKYRLGCKVFADEGPRPACHHPSNVFGDHALSCGRRGERIMRHNSIRDQVHNIAATAMLNLVKEGMFILPGCDRRPADGYLPNWAASRDEALDITVIKTPSSRLQLKVQLETQV